MKCPICGKDVELKNRQVGTDENGEPVFNEYAICRDCKKQWNLDKQRAKKAAAKKEAAQTVSQTKKTGEAKAEAVKKPASHKEEAAKKTAARRDESVKTAESDLNKEKDIKKTAASKDGSSKKTTAENERPVRKPADRKGSSASQAKKASASSAETRTRKPQTDKTKAISGGKASGHTPKAGSAAASGAASAAPADRRPVRKRPSGAGASESSEEKRYGNIPSEKVRAKREKAVRKGYEDMLSTDPKHKTVRKKSAQERSEDREAARAVSARSRNEIKASRRAPEPEDDIYDDYEESYPRFRAARIVMGVLSLLGFAFFIYRGFAAGLQGSASGTDSSGTTYIILALCFLVAALLYFILQGKNTVFAFLLPMLFYLGSAVTAFLMRDGEMILLISAIAGGVLAVISLILAITSRGAGYDADDYDDPFEDDYDD